MARRRGGRVRIRDLVANANEKVNKAGRTLTGFDILAEKIGGLIDETQDGFTVKFVRSGEGSIMDFVTGQIDELPISIRIDVEEEDSDPGGE
ncbi:MAG TPA: hypothetical protein VMX74_01130 [Pirellulales bacterium]|nr:hypothetical protein [Pirellulales bacterium]